MNDDINSLLDTFPSEVTHIMVDISEVAGMEDRETYSRTYHGDLRLVLRRVLRHYRPYRIRYGYQDEGTVLRLKVFPPLTG